MVFRKLFAQARREILRARLLMIEGKLQREGEVIHVIAQRCYDLSDFLRRMTIPNGDALPMQQQPAEPSGELFPNAAAGRVQTHAVVQPEIFPDGRNFK